MIKTALARINFEKRQGNTERARELYFKAFNSALEKKDPLAVTFISVQYARFLAFKCNDIGRAIGIFNQSISVPQCANKVLFLSFVNFVRGLNIPDCLDQIKSVFVKVEEILNSDSEAKTQNLEQLKDVCTYYVAYLEEEAVDTEQLKEVKATKERLMEKGYLPSSDVLKTIQTQIFSHKEKLGGLGKKRQNTESVAELEKATKKES